MNSITFFYMVFAGATIFFSIMLFGKFRLPALVRYYALSSVALACLAYVIEREHSGVWFFVIVTILVKGLFLPRLILYTAHRSEALMRLQSYLRPAPSYFLAATMLVVTFLVMTHTPITQHLQMRAPLFVAISLVLLGLSFMIIRRDLYGQIIGFLVMENGIALFGLITVGSMPTMLEFGLFFLVTILVLIMATLSSQVQELCGSTGTDNMQELID